MKRLVLYISLLFLITDVFGQSSLQKRAENALRNNEYTFAINNFKSLFSQTENEDPQKAVIAYKIGYCYRHISSPLHAKLWLEKAIDLKYQEPIAYLYCADAMRMNGNLKSYLREAFSFGFRLGIRLMIEAGVPLAKETT